MSRPHRPSLEALRMRKRVTGVTGTSSAGGKPAARPRQRSITEALARGATDARIRRPSLMKLRQSRKVQSALGTRHRKQRGKRMPRGAGKVAPAIKLATQRSAERRRSSTHAPTNTEALHQSREESDTDNVTIVALLRGTEGQPSVVLSRQFRPLLGAHSIELLAGPSLCWRWPQGWAVYGRRRVRGGGRAGDAVGAARAARSCGSAQHWSIGATTRHHQAPWRTARRRHRRRCAS